MRKNKAASKKNKIDVEDLAYEEEYEEAGFCDAAPGTTVATFSFQEDAPGVVLAGSPGAVLTAGEPPVMPMAALQPVPAQSAPAQAGALPPAAKEADPSPTGLPDNRKLKSEPNGITPPIDGEYFSLKRCFAFRPSTVRLLNELKTLDPGINVYLSSIVDRAIWQYYLAVKEGRMKNSE